MRTRSGMESDVEPTRTVSSRRCAMSSTGDGHADHGVRYDYFTLPKNPRTDDLTIAIARCYQRVYGEDPAWNEGKRCPTCSTDAAPVKWNYGAPPPECCPTCGTPTVDFWPIDGIIADMQHELAQPGAVCVVARRWDTGEAIGGCWGFVMTPEALEGHVKLSGLAAALRERFPNTQRFAYQDEIFVRRQHQGLGAGHQLFVRRHRRFCALPESPTVYVMRTKRNPPSSSFRWFTNPRWGYEVVAEYRDADDRVILAQRFDRLPLMQPEPPARSAAASP